MTMNLHRVNGENLVSDHLLWIVKISARLFLSIEYIDSYCCVVNALSGKIFCEAVEYRSSRFYKCRWFQPV